MRYPHQCGQLHGYPNEITMANGAAWRQFVVARRAKSVIHQKFHRQLFGRPQTPTACSAWRASVKKAAVREAVVIHICMALSSALATRMRLWATSTGRSTMPVSPSELPAAEPRLGRDHVVRALLRWALDVRQRLQRVSVLLA